MTRLGIVGLGFGAAVQLPVFRSLQGVEVVALGSRRAHKARELAARMGIAVGGSIDDVFGASLDALVVALPPALGATVALRALERGWAVLVEKPIAESAARAGELARKAAGRTAMVDFELAELESFCALRRRAEGAPVRSVRLQWRTRSYAHERGRWSWKTDRAQHGGVLNLLGSHVFFLVEWMFGPVERLEARFSFERTLRLAPSGALPAEDRAQLRARLRGGGELDIELDNAAPEPAHRWEVDLPDARLTLRGTENGSLVLAEPLSGAVVAADTVPPGGDWRLAPFQRLAARFVDCVSRRAACFPGFDAGARVQRLIDAARASDAAGGSAVDVRDPP